MDSMGTYGSRCDPLPFIIQGDGRGRAAPGASGAGPFVK